MFVRISYVERLLARQRPGDFKPRDESECFDSTETCYAVCGFVGAQISAVMDSLAGGNLDNYLTVFGNQLYRLVLGHLKKFSVSPMGAMVVSQDVKRYQDLVRDFHIARLPKHPFVFFVLKHILLLTPY